MANGELVHLRNVDDLRFNFVTKLSHHPLTVSNIKAQLVPGHLLNQLDTTRNQQALDAFASDQTSATIGALGRQMGSEQPGPGMDFPQVIAPDSGGVDVSAVFSNLAEQNASVSDPVAHAERLATAEDRDHSALKVQATVSSPIPIAEAYAVGLAVINTDEKGPQDVLFMHRIGKLGPKPRTFLAIKEGLPVEFEIKKVDLHIYSHGEELVTDQSAKQFALTREEVLEYLVLDHSSRNRRQNLPAEPVWSLAPPQLLAAKGPDHFNYPVFVQVDANGRVTSFDSKMIIPPQVRAIVEEMFFLPALVEGEPTASSLTLNLREFFN
jgi:hypothetical protein